MASQALAQGAAPANSLWRPVGSAAAWDAAVLALPRPHALQSWAWGDFKSRWGWRARPLLLSVHDDPAAGPPQAAALVLKRRLGRLPFSFLYVPKGPILDYGDGALRRVILAQLEALARRERAIFVKIDPEVVVGWGADEPRRSPAGAKFIQELEARAWRFSPEQIQFRNTVEIDLERAPAELLAAMKPKTRYNIRLAERREVAVRPGGPADLALIAEMYLETAARDGFLARPAAYYLDGWRTLLAAGMAQPLIAEHDGRPLAAVIVVRYGRRAIYLYGASSERERPRMPNYLLQWEAIRWAQAQGCQAYDMWGAPDAFDESDRLWGVWRFKAGFNGQVVRHLGAYDFPARPLLYWLFTAALPRYRSWLRRGLRPAFGE
ncbi:MAG: lipid II:glycine glycyltransferase FemX [Candidatus Promineifilaceae bacterium]